MAPGSQSADSKNSLTGLRILWNSASPRMHAAAASAHEADSSAEPVLPLRREINEQVPPHGVVDSGKSIAVAQSSGGSKAVIPDHQWWRRLHAKALTRSRSKRGATSALRHRRACRSSRRSHTSRSPPRMWSACCGNIRCERSAPRRGSCRASGRPRGLREARRCNQHRQAPRQASSARGVLGAKARDSCYSPG